MRKILIALVLSSLLAGCVSNRILHTNATILRSETGLRSDIDFIHEKLVKLHPSLDLYISKKDLDLKFDSLKNVIQSPMSSRDFFFRLSPVIAAVRQGHTRTFPMKSTSGLWENMKIAGGMGSPFSQYDYEMFDDKFYFARNITGNKFIKPFTELVTVNNTPPQNIIARYRPTLTSDGFNSTFIERRLIKEFPTWFFYHNGQTDSVLCEIRSNDTLSAIWLKRNTKSASAKPKGTVFTKQQHDSIQKEQAKEDRKRELQGWDYAKKTYSKDLRFADPDSTIGILRITDFMDGNYEKYYRYCFRLMDSIKTKTLILDLRDNPGGRLQDVCNLYSWLTDTSFTFIEKSQLASRSSILHANYFKGNPLILKVFMGIFYPFELMSRGIQYLMVTRSDDDKFYFTFPEASVMECKNHRFKGDIYVLINGGTFSASCILASNLKGSKRAVFVGEETGGASEGTVAGKMATFTLPESKIQVTFGLAHIKPRVRSGTIGRGIMPDVEISPTLTDLKSGKDPELEYVLSRQ